MTLPTGWVETPLLDIVDLHDNRRIPLNQAERAAIPGDYPYYGANGQVGTVGKFLFDGPHILLAEDGGFFDQPGRGVAYAVDGQFWVNNHAHILSVLGDMPIGYLLRQLNSLDWMQHVSGTTRLKLTQGGMQRIQIPLPPLAEQRRIVAKLDTLTARLRRARTELNRVAALAKAMRLAALKAIFDRFGDGPLACIDSICKVGTGSTPKRGHAPFYEGGNIPWVTSGVVNQGIVSRPTEYITQAAIRDTNCKVFPAGSLLVALYGEGKTRGKVAALQIDAATNQALAVLHHFDKDRVIPRWIEFFLLGRYEETREQAAGGVQPNLNLGIVKAITLPLPPINEQVSAISTLETAFARADRLEAEAASARALLDRLEAAIVARAFRGELVPQDPADEPAAALLARIRTERAAAPSAKRGRRAMAEA